MLPFLRKRALLLIWLLASMLQLAVALPWLLVFYAAEGGPWQDALPGIWLLPLIFLSAALWEAGQTGSAGESVAVRRTLPMIAGVLLTYAIAFASLPAELRQGGPFRFTMAMMIIPIALYLWFMGTKTAADGLEYTRVFVGFQRNGVGLGAGLVVAILSKVAADPAAQLLLYWSVLLYFGAGLLLLLATRERSMRLDQAELGETGAGGERLSPLVSSMVIGLAGLTMAVAYFLTLERLMLMIRGGFALVSGALSWVLDVAMLLVYRWIYLFGLLLEPLIRWLLQRQADLPEQEAQDGELGEGFTDYFDVEPVDLEPYYPYIKLALLLLLVAGVAMLLVRINRQARVREAAMEEERVSLGFWANLLIDLRSLLTRQPAPDGAADSAPSDPSERLDPRHPRMLYRRLQAWGAQVLRPRLGGETPNRYRTLLEQNLGPAVQEPVGRVTEVYNRHRYGGQEPSAQEAAEAERQLQELEAAFTKR